MAARDPVIVGVAETPLVDGKVADGASALQIQAWAAKAALAEAGLGIGDVDGLLVAGAWGVPRPGNMAAVQMAEYLGLTPRFTDNTNAGGSSFEMHVAHAALAIGQGYCDVALILYGSTQRSERSRSQGGRPTLFSLQYEVPWGLPLPLGAYAMAAGRHMHEYGTTSAQLAEIAVAARAWAGLNPAAMMREPLTVDEVLASPMIADPLRLRDCCLVTDGGGAIVMTSAERARDLATPPVRVLGFGESMTHITIGAMPDLAHLTSAAAAGKRAFATAGVGPADIDVALIYDSFTITVLMTLEALGFCGPGEGGAFVEGGRTGPGGDFPMNTNGGGLSYAHPGMYGIFLLIEATRQLRGECGPRQVADAKLALAHGTGGTLSSGATCILARE
ncbi:MAG: acetyl-CoA acetyltransferase [Alphaproteobacteria bacterium]|jgi:acetyl-CoA acetyltransferase|nr:acetyl-CoA acetyltransferase [Alphaproteobacteria bacterium]